MQFLPIILGWTGAGGCSCQPNLPPDPPQPDPETPTAVTGTTGDTGPAPPCAWPEVEPNDTVLEPSVLGMEQRGCGVIGEPYDSDQWAFTLENDSWLEVQVKAANGSIADMTFLLSPKGDSWSAARSDDPGGLDATMRFPAPASDYLLQVTEQDFNGGERFGYTVLVSEAKAPVEWTRNEVEPNDSLGTLDTPLAHAEVISLLEAQNGVSIFGTINNTAPQIDLDHFVLTVPEDKHTLSIDIDAYDYGSAADLTVRLYDQSAEPLPAGCKDEPCTGSNCCAMEGGTVGLEFDPLGDYDSPGAENVYIQVSGLVDSPADWYVLKLELTE